jgi:amidophosphoribosyltransferase
MFDKFREECGVFGIYGNEEASRLAYLGLYALQHRGQESAGIVSSDGEKL